MPRSAHTIRPPLVTLLFVCGGCMAPTARQPVPSAQEDFLTANIDTSVAPGEDFFLYANGTWFKRNPLPADEGGWGIWNLVVEDIYLRQRRLSEAAAARIGSAGGIDQLVGDFWFTGIDSVRIERQGLSPLHPDFDRIDRIHSINDLMDVVASFHSKQIRAVLFQGFVTPDEQNSDKGLYSLALGGLSMRSPEFYFNNDPRMLRIRSAFRLYLFKTFLQLDRDSASAQARADTVYALETRIARAWYRGDGYNKIGVADLQRLAPAIDWQRYMRAIGITKPDSVNATKPKFYVALDAELRRTSLDVWKDYLRFWLINASAPSLDRTSVENAFAFTSTMTGETTLRPRWKRVLNAEADALGEPLVRLFAAEYFSAREQARYRAVFEGIREAFRKRITNLDWMTDATKQQALHKLAQMTAIIGYPDKWTDFSAMSIRRDAFVLNVMRANEWYHHRDIQQVNAPADKSEWFIWFVRGNMRGAHYEEANNQIQLAPGSFVAPGLNDDQLDDAFVYGYTFIGHEISHGFDNRGRNFDANGNRMNWWTAKDSVEFTKRADALVAQYNAFIPLDTFHVDGRRTLGENIADLAGLRITLDAFKETKQFKNNVKIAGLTPLQRFFLAFAYRQMGQRRKESLANQLMRDGHAPDKERVNGVVMNIPEFYEAFNVKPGDRIYRPEHARVSIW